MLQLKANGDIKLSVTTGKKEKSYVQDKVPMKKALEYSEGEIELFKKALEEDRQGPTENELLSYRIEFLANLFDAEEVTKSLLLEELDTNEFPVLFRIINQRVLGNTPAEEKSEQQNPKE